ncbi:MAG TPA: AMP-binding protein [Ktedonobacterales bacterium]
MDSSAYWNPKNETLPREELERLQLTKLRRLVEWAHANSEFHRTRWDAAGFHPEQLKTLSDIRRIPFMTREAWMESIAEKPLFGHLPATSPEHAIRYHLTSGTSGRTPIRVLDSMKDWEWIAEMWCYGLWAFGVRPQDTVYVAFGYGQFIGFWGLHYGCEKIGALVIPGGAQTTEARVKMIMDMGVTTVASTPTYALRLWQQAAEMGYDLAKDSKVNKLILSGEPAGSIPAVKKQLEDAWGAKCGDTAGMTEVGTIMMFECEKQPGGTHIIEDHYIEEVINPATGEPVGYGELGERVVTSFGRGFIPVLRYRTKDMVVKVPHTNCTCGRTGDLYDGGIRGRWDDMKLIRGTNVYPRAVEAIVREYDAIDEFQMYIWRNDIRDEITIKVELKPGRESEWPSLGDELARALAQAHENLHFLIELMEPGTLPRFELKARRLVDARPTAIYNQ